jgi:hypothetical protein
VERLVPEAFVLEEELIQRESLPKMQITWNPGVKLANPYVVNTQRKLHEAKKKLSKYHEYGLCRAENDETFQVSVGPDNIMRALAILQIPCTALESRGYPIGPKPKDPKEKREVHYGFPVREPVPIYAKVLDTYISFRIIEKSFKRELTPEHRKNSYSKFEYVLSGKLSFEILTSPYGKHARHTWRDGKNLRIEHHINEFIISMIRIATMEKENAAQAEIRHKQWLIEEEKRRERERLQQMENSKPRSWSISIGSKTTSQRSPKKASVDWEKTTPTRTLQNGFNGPSNFLRRTIAGRGSCLSTICRISTFSLCKLRKLFGILQVSDLRFVACHT